MKAFVVKPSHPKQHLKITRYPERLIAVRRRGWAIQALGRVLHRRDHVLGQAESLPVELTAARGVRQPVE